MSVGYQLACAASRYLDRLHLETAHVAAKAGLFAEAVSMYLEHLDREGGAHGLG